MNGSNVVKWLLILCLTCTSISCGGADEPDEEGEGSTDVDGGLDEFDEADDP